MRCNNSLDGDARLVLSDVDTEFAVAGERGEEGPCRVMFLFFVFFSFCFVQ